MMLKVKSGTYRAITAEYIWSNSSFQIAGKLADYFFIFAGKEIITESKEASYHTGSVAEFIFPSIDSYLQRYNYFFFFWLKYCVSF